MNTETLTGRRAPPRAVLALAMAALMTVAGIAHSPDARAGLSVDGFIGAYNGRAVDFDGA